MTEFKLTEKEEEKLKKWKDAIKELHGQYGLFTYEFTPYGMGTGVKVYSHLIKKTLDISDVSDW